MRGISTPHKPHSNKYSIKHSFLLLTRTKPLFIGFTFPLPLIFFFFLIKDLVDVESYTNNMLLTHISQLLNKLCQKSECCMITTCNYLLHACICSTLCVFALIKRHQQVIYQLILGLNIICFTSDFA